MGVVEKAGTYCRLFLGGGGGGEAFFFFLNGVVLDI